MFSQQLVRSRCDRRTSRVPTGVCRVTGLSWNEFRNENQSPGRMTTQTPSHVVLFLFSSCLNSYMAHAVSMAAITPSERARTTLPPHPSSSPQLFTDGKTRQSDAQRPARLTLCVPVLTEQPLTLCPPRLPPMFFSRNILLQYNNPQTTTGIGRPDGDQ